MRLDKLLANMGVGSRKEVKNLLKKKHVTVDGKAIKNGSTHINPESSRVMVNQQLIHYKPMIYLMLHKPQGCISATSDPTEKTVISFLKKRDQHYQPFPVGRLDKDTEGLLLLTNDGDLAHQLTSPKKEVKKVYYARIDGIVTQEDVTWFSEGITIDGGYKTKPAKLEVLSADIESNIKITITEGKYHQVKRMFQAVGKRVLYLKRLSMGELLLDENLQPGDYRELNTKEIQYCQHLSGK